MKNKYIIAVAFFVVILITATVLSSCFSEKDSVPTDTSEQSFDENISAYYPVETQPLNMEELIPEAFELAYREVISDSDPEYLKKLSEVAKYTIDSITEENGRYLIKTTVSAPNIGEKLTSLTYTDMPQITNGADVDAYLCSLIDELSPVSTEVTVYAEWTGERINVSFTDEFVDAMCGKVYSYARDALNDYLEDNQ